MVLGGVEGGEWVEGRRGITAAHVCLIARLAPAAVDFAQLTSYGCWLQFEKDKVLTQKQIRKQVCT